MTPESKSGFLSRYLKLKSCRLQLSFTDPQVAFLGCAVLIFLGRMFLESERETLKADMENQLKSLASEVEALKVKVHAAAIEKKNLVLFEAAPA